MLDGDNSVRRCKTVVDIYRQCRQYQNLAIADRGPGEQLSLAPPPGRASYERRRPPKIQPG